MTPKRKTTAREHDDVISAEAFTGRAAEVIRDKDLRIEELEPLAKEGANVRQGRRLAAKEKEARNREMVREALAALGENCEHWRVQRWLDLEKRAKLSIKSIGAHRSAIKNGK